MIRFNSVTFIQSHKHVDSISFNQAVFYCVQSYKPAVTTVNHF